MAIKKFKVGVVQSKKSGDGVTIRLGNYSKNEKYATTTEVIVRDHAGNILASVKEGYLQVVNPRQREGLTEEQAAKIPDYIKSELFVVVNDEQK